jgi:transcriptional regulator with XRE-family HTH domain
VFGVRLRQARERAGMSQESVATSAGIDEFSASARLSQYETGKHVPRYAIACKLAEVLRVPVSFLYAQEDSVAELLLLWQDAGHGARLKAMAALAK